MVQQMSMFDMAFQQIPIENMGISDMAVELPPLERLGRAAQRGSGFEGGKVRIYAAAANMDAKALASFLKDEYGIGGSSFEEGFLDYGSSGMEYKEWKTNHREKYSWLDVAKEIKRLICENRYLTDKDLERTEKIRMNHRGTFPVPHPRFHYE